MKFKGLLNFLGVPIVGFLAIVFGWLARVIELAAFQVGLDVGKLMIYYKYCSLMFIAFTFIVIFAGHIYEYFAKHKRDFRLVKSFTTKLVENSPEKNAAMYPKVNDKYLFKKPKGLVLGRFGKKYVCVDLNNRETMHGLILGGTGSGKSSGPYITSLILNFIEGNPINAFFAIDIKPELALKSVDITKPYVRILDPTSFKGWGWDPYFALNSTSSDDEVLHVLDGIAHSLIISSSSANEFFYKRARDLFKGIMFYFYCKQVWYSDANIKSGFVDAIQEIIENDSIQLINDILSEEDMMKEHPKIRMLLKSFVGNESEALTDIKLTLQENLNVFMLDTVKYQFQDNCKKCSPKDLENGISIFLSIPEYELNEYRAIFGMCSYQALEYAQSRPDNSDKKITFILDEVGRIPKISNLADSLTCTRSRNVSIWLCLQSLSMFEDVYGDTTARKIADLCEITCLLSTNDTKTAKDLAERVGKYRETKVSIKVNAEAFDLSPRDVNESIEYRNIVEPSDLLSLGKTNEAIIWIKGDYARITKFGYYMSNKLNKYSKNVLRKNKEVLKHDNTF